MTDRLWRLLAWGLLAGLGLLPTLAGLLGILGPAFGYFPALGFTAPGLSVFARVLAMPGQGLATLASLWVGLAATAIALLLATMVTAGLDSRVPSRWLEWLAAPLIAVPHLAVAVGAAFLLAPSGWLVRLVAAPLGLAAPPTPALGATYDLAVLTLVLVVKETPFLVAVLATIARQDDSRPTLALARSLGYGELEARLKVLAPAWLARSRLAVLAVLVYAIGNVELALVLGPTRPSLLSVRVLELLQHPDLARRLDASATAVLLVLATGLGVAAWWLLGQLGRWLFERWLALGPTPRLSRWLGRLADLATLALLAVVALTAAMLVLWSVAGAWRFPDVLPARLGLWLWLDRADVLLALTARTALIGGLVSFAALAIVLLWLEVSGRTRPPVWLWAPLVVPQLAFLFGLQMLLSAFGSRPGFGPLLAAHLVFVLPYTALLLADGWAHQDPRYALLARSLGHGRWSAFWRVKLPMLKGPVALTLAIGFSVSIALYLPTLVGGGGRVGTLALELVGLAAGGDRRLAAATGVLLAALPLAALGLARRISR